MTSPTVGIGDQLALPLAQTLLSCLCAQLELTVAGAPARCCLVPGGPNVPWDDCCGGQAWVRVDRVYPTKAFPAQMTTSERCDRVQWAVVLELGTVRCACTVGDDGEPPSCECLAGDVDALLSDMQAMITAVTCCFAGQLRQRPLIVGAWTPSDILGGCQGGSMTVTVLSDVCSCDHQPPAVAVV